MNTTVQRWGNSHGIRLPKVILEESGIKENDRIMIFVEGDSIILKKEEKTHISLKDRLEQFYRKPIESIEIDESELEFATGVTRGEEIW